MDLGDPADPPEPDTVLRLQGGAEIQVHSLLLRLASPVLRVALAAPVANGKRRVDLPDDALDAWKLLYHAISPGEIDVFTNYLHDKPFEEQLRTLRSLLGLAHKYGIERVVQQACQCAYQEITAKALRKKNDWKANVREMVLWLDLLQRLDLHSAYSRLYRLLVDGDSGVRKLDIVKMIKKLQRVTPPVLLHAQLLTDLLLTCTGYSSSEEEDASEGQQEDSDVDVDEDDMVEGLSSDMSEDDSEEDEDEDEDEESSEDDDM